MSRTVVDILEKSVAGVLDAYATTSAEALVSLVDGVLLRVGIKCLTCPDGKYNPEVASTCQRTSCMFQFIGPTIVKAGLSEFRRDSAKIQEELLHGQVEIDSEKRRAGFTLIPPAKA